MTVIFKRAPWKRLLERSKETAAGVGEAARTGAAIVEQKAEETVACAKLRRAVRDVQEEIDLQMRAVGEMVYATHKGNPSDSDEMQKILEYVDGLYEQMEGHLRQLKLMQGSVFCEACGAENAGANAYCQECGQPLRR